MSRARWVLIVLIGLNAALLVAGAGRGKSVECAAELCVGLVFDVGGLGDKSFNDAAYRGLLRVRDELGAEIHYIEPARPADKEAALRHFASQGFDLVIGTGYVFSDDVRKLAAAYPDINFACIDYAPAADRPDPPNLAGLRFREQEGSFLVGAIAGLETESRSVGFVGGMDIPLIRKFEAGYRAGVRAVCPDCRVLSAYAGTQAEAFNDPVKGKELALTQYGRGADIIYHAAGKTGKGVFNAAREKGREAIGVDSDQYSDAPCCVITSMIKKVDVAVFDAARRVAEGTFSGGLLELGLADDGVGYVYDDNNRDKLAAETVERVEELRRAIIEGRVEVPER
jgi:basic membrane protein A